MCANLGRRDRDRRLPLPGHEAPGVDPKRASGDAPPRDPNPASTLDLRGKRPV